MTEKILKTKDVFLMTVAANLGARWIAVAAALGFVSLSFWFLSAIFFLIPISLIVIEFSTRYPEEGGIYVWVQKHLGHRASFLVAWCYWINNFFYYPALLTFFATSFVYACGWPDLAKNQMFITCTVIVAFWIILLCTLSGIKMGKFAGALGGYSSSLIIVTLIVLGFSTLFLFHQSATPFHFSSLIPSGALVDNLSSLSLLMFAMAGVEIIPTLANSIEHPQRVLPKALSIFALFLFLAYALGTVAMQIILSPDEIHKTTGLIETFHLIGLKLGIPFLARAIAVLIALGELAALMLWILIPAIMFFKVTDRGVLPDFFHRENKKGIPANALLLEGVVITLIILCTTFLPTVNVMYQLLILMTTIVFFIPYLFVIAAYVQFKREGGKGPYEVPGGKKGALTLSALVAIALVFAICVSFIPTKNLVTAYQVFVYEAELIIGTLATVLIALWLYARHKKR